MQDRIIPTGNADIWYMTRDASDPNTLCSPIYSVTQIPIPESWTAVCWIGMADLHPYQQCGQKFPCGRTG